MDRDLCILLLRAAAAGCLTGLRLSPYAIGTTGSWRAHLGSNPGHRGERFPDFTFGCRTRCNPGPGEALDSTDLISRPDPGVEGPCVVPPAQPVPTILPWDRHLAETAVNRLPADARSRDPTCCWSAHCCTTSVKARPVTAPKWASELSANWRRDWVLRPRQCGAHDTWSCTTCCFPTPRPGVILPIQQRRPVAAAGQDPLVPEFAGPLDLRRCSGDGTGRVESMEGEPGD